MAYSESYETEFVHFSTEEDNLVRKWLKRQGYTWVHNTVCGDCCGMYEDEYWVNGIGGKFPDDMKDKFIRYAKRHNIGARVEGYTIQAYEGEAHRGSY